MGGIIVSVCYRSLVSERERTKSYLSNAETLVLRRDFSFPDTCWKGSTYEQTRRFPETVKRL